MPFQDDALEEGSKRQSYSDVTTDGILHLGYSDYRHRFRSRRHLQERRIALRYLHMAFEKLPKLCHLMFTDFRSLGRNEEDFSELCTRPFGDTV